MNRVALPIDPHLADLVAALRHHPTLVLEAPPGSGKTTRLPPALLEAMPGRIVVTQPRRLAARLAARRVAEERGEDPGQTVGWRVRFEDRTGPATRLIYQTEGTFLRALAARPTLDEVSAVLIDEVHERHLDTDLVLGHLLALQAGARPDLRIVLMSATIEAEALAARLPGAVVRRIECPAFPVDITFAGDDDRPLERRVAAQVRGLLDESEGDVLVFLPGVREILAAERTLRGDTEARGFALVKLHGGLLPEAQDLAVRPHPERRVILATNVAESSVTLPAVTCVVDSGLARHAGFDPWSGLPRLDVRPISQASATQRAGRAGRLRPGRCVRLYSEYDFRRRPRRTAPEVERADLAGAVLELAVAGFDVDRFPWPTPPPPTAQAAALRLLGDLGALDVTGQPTARGRRMARLPLHPRLARMVVEAAERGVGRAAAQLAAILSECDPRALQDAEPAGRDDAPSDLLVLAARLARGGGDPALRQAVSRAARQIAELAGLPASDRGDEADLLRAVLAGFPDRLARRRGNGGEIWVAARGGELRQSARSRVRRAPLAVVVDAEHRDGAAEPTAHLLSAIEEEWLWDLEPSLLDISTDCLWDAARQRVFAVERLRWDRLVLSEKRRAPGPAEAEAAGALLAKQVLARGLAAFFGQEALDAWRGRLRFAAPFLARNDLPLDDESLERQVRRACLGRRAIADLPSPGQLLGELIDPPTRAELDRLAPLELRLPGGRRVRVHYAEGQIPWVGSLLQDFFGQARTPTVADGRVPLAVHLLGPNRRALQVTTDLAGFWRDHYPALRKELARRYPRHAWPDNPLTASPPTPRRR